MHEYKRWFIDEARTADESISPINSVKYRRISLIRFNELNLGPRLMFSGLNWMKYTNLNPAGDGIGVVKTPERITANDEGEPSRKAYSSHLRLRSTNLLTQGVLF